MTTEGKGDRDDMQRRAQPEEEWFCPAVERQIAHGLCWEYSYAGRGGPSDTAGELRQWIGHSGKFASLEDFHRVCQLCEHRH